MNEVSTQQKQTKEMLHELGFPSHYEGYRQLVIAVPYYAQDPVRRLTKELYPYVSRQPGCSGDVESSIRRTILRARKNGKQSAWEKYFPEFTKTSSNLVFIATLAEYLKNRFYVNS